MLVERFYIKFLNIKLRFWPECREVDSMFDIYRKELDWGGKKLILETGKIARQADGAVMATLGETTVLCTAVGARNPKPGLDFFPLTVKDLDLHLNDLLFYKL